MNKKGFTLIELLAVIIILGILMIIAIPSVTSYINNSRKSAYVDTAKEIVSGTRNIVNEGKLGMYDTKTTYYIPASYISTENGLKSPYGEFTEAYVGVIYDGKGYKYYWVSVDETGQGIDKIRLSDKLNEDDIKSDLLASDIKDKVETTGIGNRNKILILNDGVWSSPYQPQHLVSESGELKSKNRTIADIMDLYVATVMEEDLFYLLEAMPPFILSELQSDLTMNYDLFKNLKEPYGDNFSISYELTGNDTDVPSEQIEQYNEIIRNELNITEGFTRCRMYGVILTMKGSLKETVDDAPMPLCEYDGSWYILIG